MTRTILKTASYAITHFMVAVSVAYVLTGSWAAALAIGLVEPAVQTLAYGLHEWAWSYPKASPAAGELNSPAPC